MIKSIWTMILSLTVSCWMYVVLLALRKTFWRCLHLLEAEQNWKMFERYLFENVFKKWSVTYLVRCLPQAPWSYGTSSHGHMLYLSEMDVCGYAAHAVIGIYQGPGILRGKFES